MKILIVTPTYLSNGRMEIEQECIDGILRQKLNGHSFDWVVVTGKSVESFTEKTTEQVNAYNKWLNPMFNTEYDAMLTLESDIIMRGTDVIQKMADFLQDNQEIDIVTAPHRARPKGVYHSHVVLFSEAYGAIWYRLDALNKYYKQMRWRTPFPVGGSGLGCVLIKKRVFEKVKFGGIELVDIGSYSEEERKMAMGVDTQFFTNCLRNGVKTFCIPTVDIGHRDTDGKIYYIDEQFFEDIVNRNIVGELMKDILIGVGEDIKVGKIDIEKIKEGKKK